MKDYRVLVIGPRRGLIEELRERRIPFSIWQARNSFNVPAPEKSVIAPLWNSAEKNREQVRKSFSGQRFTHVIAGNESSVLPAEVVRRQVGARLSSTAKGTRCRDKLHMKQCLAEFGIPMTRFLADSASLDSAKVFAELGSPVVRKFRKSSGGRGLALLERPQDYVPGSQGDCILERYVDAPEASVESFIDKGKIQFTNITAYHRKGHSNFVPAVLEKALSATLLELNERVISALGLAWGMTHLEVYLTKNGPLFGEIALRPPGGYIMNAMTHAWDFNPWAAFVAMELGEAFSFPEQPSLYAAAEVLYPGAGRVSAVRGESRVLDEPGIREFRLKVKVGDCLQARAGLGQDTGYIVHASASPAERLTLHELIERELIIELAAETTSD
jgi:biotin carboxylase